MCGRFYDIRDLDDISLPCPCPHPFCPTPPRAASMHQCVAFVQSCALHRLARAAARPSMRGMPHVSVRIASELTGKDRSTITRSVDAGKLSATKDEHGRFLIDPAELERVFGSLALPADARIDAVHEHAQAL